MFVTEPRKQAVFDTPGRLLDQMLAATLTHYNLLRDNRLLRSYVVQSAQECASRPNGGLRPIPVRKNLRELSAKEKDLCGVIDPDQQDHQRSGGTVC